MAFQTPKITMPNIRVGRNLMSEGQAFTAEEIQQGKHLSGYKQYARDSSYDPKFYERESGHGFVKASDGKYIAADKLGAYEQSKAMKAQESEADKFAQNLPKFEEEIGSDIMGTTKKAIAQGQAGIAQSASRRGLLHSGLRQGAQKDVETKGLLSAGQQMAGVSESLQNQRRKMQDVLADMRLDKWQQDVQEADAAYKRALADYQSSSNMWSSILGAGGAVAGGLIGGAPGAIAGSQVGQTAGRMK